MVAFKPRNCLACLFSKAFRLECPGLTLESDSIGFPGIEEWLTALAFLLCLNCYHQLLKYWQWNQTHTHTCFSVRNRTIQCKNKIRTTVGPPDNCKLLIWAHRLFEIHSSGDTQPKLNEDTKRNSTDFRNWALAANQKACRHKCKFKQCYEDPLKLWLNRNLSLLTPWWDSRFHLKTTLHINEKNHCAIQATSVPKYHCLWRTQNASHFTHGRKCSPPAVSRLLLTKKILLLRFFFNGIILNLLPAYLLQGLNLSLSFINWQNSSLQSSSLTHKSLGISTLK